ncbi:MAG: recombinase RecT [Peptococcales bacterium]|jgi:recombination protein RecT
MENKATQAQQQPQAESNLSPAEIKNAGASARFTEMIMRQYGSTVGANSFSQRETQLIKGYFIAIDEMLRTSEAERLRKNANNKNHDYDNNLAYSWNTVDLPQLALDLAHYARMGLDMQQDNHLFPIPYKDNKANRYTITLMEGYNGIRYQAEKYAVNPPKNVVVEVVYTNDRFTPIKKGRDNPGDTYTFDIPNPFDRGKPVGAFGFIEYEDPSKNVLVVMSRADIEKRKPKYASPEFWGGVKKTWENGRQVETQIEGWEPEMFAKTMKREIYSAKHIPRDPMKIDDTYHYIKQREAQYAVLAAENEADQQANTVELAFDDATISAPAEPQAIPEAPQEAQEPPQEPQQAQGKETPKASAKAQKSGKARQEQIGMTTEEAMLDLPWAEEPNW